jgi:hypothetical protein
MFVGHVAVAFVGKRVEPEISLGTLLLASMLPDVLWPIFTMAGMEYTRKVEDTESHLFEVPVSHSLLMVAIWGALFAVGYFLFRRVRRHQLFTRGALILFAAVLSHWVLDAISHKHALAPGTNRYYGLMLWDSLPATLIVEGSFWLVALILYIRATRARNWAGIYGFWPVIAFITYAWVSNIRTGPPPPEKVIGSLVFFSLLIAWAYWMNRARPAEPTGSNSKAAGSS